MQDTHFALDPSVSDAWMKEYDSRAQAVNRIYEQINDGAITEKNITPAHRRIIALAMEMQILFAVPEEGQKYGYIKKAEPMVEGKDYFITTRDGVFGVYANQEA